MASSKSATMNIRQLVRELLWEPETAPHSVRRKRERSLTSKLASPGVLSSLSSLSRKSCPPELQLVIPDISRDSFYVQGGKHPGGTRWNPTHEQIGILETLYTGGMRTPNAQQIEQITLQLGRYGQIEGKNVFYWFQNHKARERQRHKRDHSHQRPYQHATSISQDFSDCLASKIGVFEKEYPNKRKCLRSSRTNCGIELYQGSWSGGEVDDDDNRTLELFPLHPEGSKLL